MWDEIRDWMTAIGTVGAVIVALWLARKGSDQARHEAKERAGMYAAGIVSQLSAARAMIYRFEVICDVSNLTVSPETSDLQAIERVARELEAFSFKPSSEALLGLIPLPRNCANRIGMAFGLVDHARMQIAHFTSMADDRALASGTFRKILREEWRQTFAEAVAHLDVALQECVKASKLAAPTPTAEERYAESAAD